MQKEMVPKNLLFVRGHYGLGFVDRPTTKKSVTYTSSSIKQNIFVFDLDFC